MSYTSDDLVKSIKRGVTIPNFQALLSDQDILDFANEEIESLILPEIMALRSEFLVVVDEVSIVAGQSEYDLPYRAVGRGLRDAQYRVDTQLRNLPYISPEDNYYYTNNGTGGTPRGFYFRGDKVVIVPPSDDNTAFLRMSYHMRPNKLVPVSSCGTITNINTGTNTVTVNVAPSGISTSSLCDFVQAKQGCQTIDFDLTPTAVLGTQITFSELPSSLVKGDYLCLAETAPVFQFPQECLQPIAQAAQCRVLEAVGDLEGLQKAKERLDEKIKQMRNLLTPRVEGEPQKVVNRAGLLRRNPFLRYSRRYVG